MRNLFTIAVNAFRESLREPVYALMLLAALILIAHYPSMSIFVFSEIEMICVTSVRSFFLQFATRLLRFMISGIRSYTVTTIGRFPTTGCHVSKTG